MKLLFSSLPLIGLLISSVIASAQTFTTLHSFAGYPNDGEDPYARLLLSGNTLYGTTDGGGNSYNGTVFAVNTDGTGFTNLHSFTSKHLYGIWNTNSDGANPRSELTLLGNALYGTAYSGGSRDHGTAFTVKTDGTGFTNLHSFMAAGDAAVPWAGLVLAGNTLYGTTYWGGTGRGTVFTLKADGTNITILHSFMEYARSNGVNPSAGLVLSGNTLYGTAYYGGSSDNGIIFKMSTNGTGFTVLKRFAGSDGANPRSSLILSGSTLYGTTAYGGISSNGTIFALATNGTGFTILHSFTALSSNTNGDGANPYAGLILSGNTLYGTAKYGGGSGKGTVFAVNTDGTGFMNLHSFSGSDGASPWAGLIIFGNTLYGTTRDGGSSGKGTVFSLSFTPQLKIIPTTTNVVLTWATNVGGFDYSGFTLRSATSVVPPVVWTTVSPAPVVVNSQYTVTNPISGTQQFYRLSQ